MEQPTSGQTNTVNVSGYDYKVDGRFNKVGVREVPPNGSRNWDSSALSPHPEQGKRQRGWRLEWIIFILILACLLSSLVTHPLAMALGR